ncbi:MAG: ATP-grasp domain-containing protein [Rhodospirillales bacterium]|nr:ATP-grasp domain-containing protein [Rhodospirillales bacterium]
MTPDAPTSGLAAPLASSLASPARARGGRAASFFEFWPGWMFYTPIVVQWLGLGLRYGDMTLPTAANPGIVSGGLCGETKTSMLDLVEGPARASIAPYAAMTTSPTGAGDLAAAEAAMARGGLGYPLVVKPDIGCNGTGVRLAENAAALDAYLAAFPRGEGVVLQEFVPLEGEAGIFYIRDPGSETGRISSVTLKFAPHVTGDGRATLRQLILADTRFGRIASMFLPRLTARLDEVPAAGEAVRLVFVGNHCKGSIFRDGAAEVTPALAACFERIARAMPEFHFGRFDIRFGSLAALRRGEDFRIIEINGVGSEATHVWDPDTSLWEAWRAQFHHYRAAWRIGAANRARGHRSTGLRALAALWRRQKRLMAAYPLND